MGSITTEPMTGIEFSNKDSTSKTDSLRVGQLFDIPAVQEQAELMDVELPDATQATNAIMEIKQPASLKKTVLATRSTDAVIEDLSVSTKKLKVKRSDSVASSSSANSRASAGKVPQKHTNGDIGDIAEEEDDEQNLAYSGDEDETVPEPTEDQERSYELEVLKSYLRTQEINAIKNPKKVVPELENQQSVRWLANNTGAGQNQIISTPREYQIELFEKAKEENIIAVLDTGSGKTLIAVLLLQHVINEELERRDAGLEKKISFFLVDSVALVFQQATVLRCNLNQNVAQICGEMGTDRWSKEPWIEYMEKNMVIVLTAEVLYQALHHSYINMNQINLLIFDEAHHAKRNHPYARIIKDFYVSDDKDASELPRIFGMTASPVDARVDVEKAAMDLENLLSCRILTSTDESMAQWQRSKVKTEVIAQYDLVGQPFQTPLFNQIFDKLRGMKECLKPLIFAKQASAELGAWAADEVFRISYTADEVEKMKIRVEAKFNKKNLTDSQPMEQLEDMLRRLREVADIVANHSFESPKLTSAHLSNKVMTLVAYLRERYENPTEDKAIIFVSQRLTARLLTVLLSQVDIGRPHLRVDSLVGSRSSGGGDDVTFRGQMVTLRRFRTGELNCLFATSVAEEGLDIPDCNLIIRFDLYQTVIQYIQSRGRARLANSLYIHMMEKGNGDHITLIRTARADSATLQAFYTKLPEDRKLMGNTHNLDFILAKERAQTRTYKEENGGTLTYRMALNTLSNFVASLTHKDDSTPNAEYVMGRKGNKFLCEVILPEASPISGAVGLPADTKQVAKCSAAFEACMALRRGKHLNKHLVSVYKNRGPLMRNARLALGSTAKKQYAMRTKPALWKLGSIHELYLTIMHLQNPERLGRPSQAIGLLTRGPLPRIPQFHLFFTKTERSLLICRSITGSLKLDDVTLQKLDKFTLKIFYDLFSKQYDSDMEIMAYFIVPIVEDFSARLSLVIDPSELIAWDVIDAAVANQYLSWDENTPDSEFEGLWIVDPMEGSRRLWTKKVTHEHKPTSPIPRDAVRREERWYRVMKEEQEDKSAPPTILQYSNSAWARTRKAGHKKWKVDQPVIEADVVPLRRNFLDDRDIPDKAPNNHCYICPEPLALSTIPPKVVVMTWMFPSIIHRVESYLIALEAASMLNLPLTPELALECLTKDSTNTEDHGEEQVAFQRGMGNNYERLEFYGDCFLKMATSISIYTLHPDGKELDFHVKRMLMICNQNLMNVAKKLGLHEYIRSEGFNRRSWYPESLVLAKGFSSKQPKKTHNLGDKTIADIPEALIGAALLTPAEDNPMDNAVRAVTELVCSADHNVQKWADYYKLYKKPKYQTAAVTASQVDLARQVEARHNYHFRHPRVLRSAFTHSTMAYIWAKVPNYQRLEFLGDSILDMVCVRYLFRTFPNKDPQWLTEHKMAMVSNQFLGALCVELGFHRHLQHSSSVITNSIVDYVAEFDEAKENAIKEAVAAGKPESGIARDFWMHTKHPPKFLADMIESYIGAVFVDSEFNYHEIERFFDQHIKWFFEDVTLYDTFAKNHPVTALNHFLERNMGCVKYRLNATQLPDAEEDMPTRVIATVMVHSQVICSVERESARYAKVACASDALGMLRGDSPAQFREKWGCDCRAKGRVAVTVRDEGEKFREVKRQVDVRMRDCELTSTEQTDSAGSRKPSVAYG